MAEAVPERLEQLIYFNAFLPFDGECVLAVGRDAGPSELCTAPAAKRMLNEVTATGGIPPGWVAPGRPQPTDVPRKPAHSLFKGPLKSFPVHFPPVFLPARAETGRNRSEKLIPGILT